MNRRQVLATISSTVALGIAGCSGSNGNSINTEVTVNDFEEELTVEFEEVTASDIEQFDRTRWILPVVINNNSDEAINFYPTTSFLKDETLIDSTDWSVYNPTRIEAGEQVTVEQDVIVDIDQGINNIDLVIGDRERVMNETN